MPARPSLSTIVLVSVFLVTFSFQTYHWFIKNDVLDQSIWIPVIEETVEVGFISPHLERFGYPYGYPGATLLYPGALLLILGFSGDFALRSSMAFFISLGITLAVWACHRLRPETLWWFGAWGILLFSGLYFDATPPSAMAMPFMPALLFLTLLAKERGVAERWPLLLLGGVGGIALATRLDISLVILAMSFLYLLFTLGTRTWYFAASSVVAFVLANPFVWGRPVEYVVGTYERIFASYTTYTYAHPLTSMLPNAPLTIVSLLLGLFFIIAAPRLLIVPRALLLSWLAAGASVMAVLFLSEFHPSWYFYPFFLGWEALLPAFLVGPLPFVTLPPELPRLTRRHIEFGLVLIPVIGQLVLFTFITKPP